MVDGSAVARLALTLNRPQPVNPRRSSLAHLSGWRRLALLAWIAVGIAPTQLSGRPQQAPRGDDAPPVTVPSDYVIGVEDVLSVVFWRDKDLSADVVVRPDGKISLPLLNDIQAAGHTPQQLSDVVVKAASKFVEQPSVTVIVKEINSRKVYVVGQVPKPGAFPLTGDMNVVQLIAMAGGVHEYADSKNVVIVRREHGVERRLKMNYKDVLKGKNVAQNVLLNPGDTVIVP
jgi:polysaccharide biosynthesis/export protein